MPTKEALGLDDREDLQDRRKPAIKQDKEPALFVSRMRPGSLRLKTFNCVEAPRFQLQVVTSI
jgi:hypothetical protein